MARGAVRQTVQVRVKPQARCSTLTRADDGTWLAHIRSPPVDGKANAELIGLFAAAFGCRKSAVSIRCGASGRTKLVDIDTG